MAFRAVTFRWDSERRVMVPLDRFSNIAASQFNDAEEYNLEIREHRSSQSHRHYFACINEAWKNLRGETAEILISPNHLRGWALCVAGYCHTQIVAAPDKDSAIKMAVFARKLASGEGYAEIKIKKIDGTWYVQSRVPMSQSRSAMNKEEFAASKNSVLDIIAGEIQVSRKTLETEGKLRGHE